MSEDDSADLVAKPLDSKYLSGLLDSISATQDHLTGNDSTHLSPSFLRPNAVWTPQEKNTLFHALSVYSRFRPDLISHEIKTKSVSDVCNYLSALQLAASQQESTVSYSQRRQDLPIAMEASSEWVTMEEEMALGIVAREQDWQRELIAEQRRAELKLLKRASKTGPHDMEPSRRKAELKREIANADLRDRQKDFCGSLGSLELTAIGCILREATNSSGSSQIKQSFPPLHNFSPQLSPVQEAVEVTQALPSSTTKVAGIQDSINPVRQRSNRNGRPLLQNSSERFQSCSPQQDSTALLAGLSPASRRRYQKRLYMRRKRASMSGVTDIDESLERLKPGRRKVKRSPSPEDKTGRDLGLSTSGDLDMEDNGNAISAHRTDWLRMAQKRYPRGKQMAIDELRNLGLTADELRRLGVDVLNPEGVAKMLNLWDKLSGDAGHGSRISVETIQLLNAHVVWFVKSLVYRTITLREQELGLKSETKVWKLSEKPVLTREDIERAVSMGNSRELNKAGFFEGVVADMDTNTEAEETGGEFAESGTDVTFPPLHREMYAPLVWIPESDDDSEMTDNTNDEELYNELLEEEELDELDMDIEMNHESGLWDKAQQFQNSDPKIEGSIRKRGQRTIYKNAEFVEDSD